ncbi:MAG: ABC transporter permease [Actinobacteria bacterium]|nr:ABC transporter permease [Actinomycetota bacterium]
MLRAAARTLPSPRGTLEEVGDIVILTGKTIVSAVRPPYPYGGELIAQFLFVLRLSWLPVAITMVVASYAVPGVEGANFLILFGALDRLGGLFVLAVIREFAPIFCAIIVAGVAGTAMTADLGARKIREELDALQVLGVDPVKQLVVPRFLALMLATGLFDVFAIVAGTAGGLVANWLYGGSTGSFLATLMSNATTTELWASVLKCTLYGAITAIVCCYKGMTASGGPEGVGRAVNQAIVISYLAIGAFDYLFTQTLLATHPQMSVLH